MSGVQLRSVTKAFGTQDVIKSVDIEIERGEFCVFVGPSGCGKSTLLRMIAGLEDITSGEITIGGERVNDKPPKDRGISMVFQSYALFPHKTVYENMAYGLRIAGEKKAVIDQKVRAAAAALKMETVLNRKPAQLSGGQRQRVAIGRAIVRNPQVFLFDEPLSNLDAALRVATRFEIAQLKESMPDSTMIYVTHDQVEAMTLANRIVVLNEGRVEQIGPPMDLYHRPANTFVARFIGSPAMNLLNGEIDTSGGLSRLRIEHGGTVPIPAMISGQIAPGPIAVGIRPEAMLISNDKDGVLAGTVRAIEALGDTTVVHFDIAGREEPAIAKLPGAIAIARGQAVKIDIDTDALHLFDSRSGERLN